LEQIRNVAIGAAGNLVFISNKKSNPEKFISIFQHHNYWFTKLVKEFTHRDYAIKRGHGKARSLSLRPTVSAS
jgi:hypothetical protein